MGMKPTTNTCDGPIENLIGTAYDVVKTVYDNMPFLKSLDEVIVTNGPAIIAAGDLALSSSIVAVNAADESEASAVVAATKADEANTSAVSALASKTNAATSASNASSSASAAASSASTASGAANTATTKASQASTSATNAATSATNAATSASNAGVSTSTATSAASTATTKASEAAVSANNAATSATNAANSASSASTSATTATTGASTATTKAGEATTAATMAQKWASEATDVIVASGKYSSAHYAAKAEYWAGVAVAIGSSGNAATANKLLNSRTITATGDINWAVSFDGSNNVSAAATLPNIVTAGTGTKVSYNAKGQVTGSAALAATDIPNLDVAKITTGRFSNARLPAAASGFLKAQGTSVDPTFATLVEADIPNINASKLTGTLAVARLPAFSGDLTSSAGSSALTLNATGVTAGDYGDAITIPVITLDAKGRVLNAVTQAIRAATTAQTGVVQLSSATNSTSTTLAATPAAVKIAYDVAAAAIPATQKGAANGVATLDSSGKVPAAQLPSYVDDVLEFDNFAALPATGEASKIYIAIDTGKTYRWTGSAYLVINNSVGSADTAIKLATPRTISLTGDATGSVNFDGSTNVNIAVTVADDSHSHVISNVDGLDAALAAKAPINSPAFTGTPTAPTASAGVSTTQVATTAFVQSVVKGYLGKSVTGGTITLTADEATNAVLAFTGALTSNLIVQLPAGSDRVWVVLNGTTGAFTVTLRRDTSGSTVTVAQNKRNIVFMNSSGMFDAFNDFESIALTGVSTAPTAAVGTNTTQIATTAFVNAEIANDAPTKTGGGASGNWGIGITGNAATATKLATSRTITIAGDVAGSATFDGSTDISITATVADDSHNHIISNIDGLQTALDAKAPLASPALTGSPTAPTAAVSTNTTQLATTAFVQSVVKGYLDKTGLTGGTITLTADEATNAVLAFSGALTSNLIVQLPAGADRVWTVVNNTTGAFTLTLRRGTSGSTVLVAQTKRNIVYMNASGMFDAFNDFESIILTGTPTAPTASVGNSSTQIATTAFVNAEIANDAPTKTGGGATGSWGINVTGNAASATTLTGLTSTVTELNYMDGVTSAVQTQLNDKAPLTGGGTSGTWPISVTGSAATLTTARSINGTSFNGSANITTANWGTARTLTVGNTGKSVNGGGNVSWSLGEIGAEPALGFTPVQQGGGTEQGTNKVYIGWGTTGGTLRLQVDSTNFANSWPISVTGNSATATTLQNARTINGTSFNGSANITTSSWGTARNLTIGNTAKSVNGSANVGWSLAEIGAPSVAGVGATGTWNINVNGSANELKTQVVDNDINVISQQTGVAGPKIIARWSSTTLNRYLDLAIYNNLDQHQGGYRLRNDAALVRQPPGRTTDYAVYDQSNIVGTVSTTGGIPSGSIFEKGSNSNGTFEKFASGTQICRYSGARVVSASPYGSGLFRGFFDWTFPASFSTPPVTTGSGNDDFDIGWVSAGNETQNTATKARIHYFSPNNFSAVRSELIAIGNWN